MSAGILFVAHNKHMIDEERSQVLVSESDPALSKQAFSTGFINGCKFVALSTKKIFLTSQLVWSRFQTCENENPARKKWSKVARYEDSYTAVFAGSIQPMA